MTHKLKSETSSQKIGVSADISFGSLTLLGGFVILDLKYCVCSHINKHIHEVISNYLFSCYVEWNFVNSK